MKSIVMPGNVPLNKKKGNPENYQEPAEVKETPASEASGNRTTPMSAGITVVDMWNHQRKRRSASDMMRRWNLN
jgi:hypothetical protein